MHHVVALIAKRQGVHAPIEFVPIAKCYVPYVQGLIQNHIEPGVSLEAASLFSGDRGKAVYILPSSDPTLALLYVGLTEYDDDDDDHCSSSRLFLFVVKNSFKLL